MDFFNPKKKRTITDLNAMFKKKKKLTVFVDVKTMVGLIFQC